MTFKSKGLGGNNRTQLSVETDPLPKNSVYQITIELFAGPPPF